jgi:NAD-dependent deacetylase
MSELTEAVAALATELRNADVAGALTGAGVSVPSGIPPFRGEGGVWEKEFDPADFEAGRLQRDPAGWWKDRLELRAAMRPDGVAPNPAHRALAELESAGVLDGVLTQNTDGLHTAAGNEEVVTLHGTAEQVRCTDCADRRPSAEVFERAAEGECPPRCECGGVLRPDVVLFGESLPSVALAEARDLARRSDVFLAVGSSLTVQPAASLPGMAARDGTLAVVNIEPTPADGRATYTLRADVTEVLPALVDHLGVG